MGVLVLPPGLVGVTARYRGRTVSAPDGLAVVIPDLGGGPGRIAVRGSHGARSIAVPPRA